jgi:hypothetical protein
MSKLTDIDDMFREALEKFLNSVPEKFKENKEQKDELTIAFTSGYIVGLETSKWIALS